MEELLNRAEVAEIAGVSLRTLERWDSDGFGPQSIRLGRRTVRYRRADIERWLDASASHTEEVT